MVSEYFTIFDSANKKYKKNYIATNLPYILIIMI